MYGTRSRRRYRRNGSRNKGHGLGQLLIIGGLAYAGWTLYNSIGGMNPVQQANALPAPANPNPNLNSGGSYYNNYLNVIQAALTQQASGAITQAVYQAQMTSVKQQIASDYNNGNLTLADVQSLYSNIGF